MRAYDIIEKKKNGKELKAEEIKFFIDKYTSGEMPDYQASALLMAICINGMTKFETSELTRCMLESGETIDLSDISGVKVDKHSTGGVGDKTTLIVSPIVAACGVPVAKMSGRGLGHTGGTIDKLESIPGFRASLEREEFFETIESVGFSITSQSGNIVPADKKLYALRDVTATVESIPLIASSIMSKKLAVGSDCILLDVKTGSGAFMKSFDSSIELAKTMVDIGKSNNKETIAVITNMDIPLGNAVGNSLEVIEACEILKGRGDGSLRKVCIYLAANMLYLAGKGSLSRCKEMASNSIKDGSGFYKLREMVKKQGGDTDVLENYEKFPKAKVSHLVISDRDGYINRIDAEKCGIATVVLGAGREKKDSEIDYSAGVVFNKSIGEFVKKDDVIAAVYSSNEDRCAKGKQILLSGIDISPLKLPVSPLIQARVTDEGIEKFI